MSELFEDKLKTKEEAEIIFLYFKHKGWYISGTQGVTVETTAENYFKHFPVLVFRPEGKSISANSYRRYPESKLLGSLADVLAIVTEKKMIKVTLNDKHTAEVYKDKVVVGCQTFPITVIDNLVLAKNELTKN